MGWMKDVPLVHGEPHPGKIGSKQTFVQSEVGCLVHSRYPIELGILHEVQ